MRDKIIIMLMMALAAAAVGHYVGQDVHDNLRLRPGSLCLDVGNNITTPPLPPTDLDGEPRIQNSIVDMGAYEYLRSDINSDGTVGLEDFAQLG